MRYGLFDTTDEVWVGTNEEGTGPKLFEDEKLAWVAAQVATVRLKWEPWRLQVKPYDEGPVRMRDEVDTHMSTEEALRRLEEGKAW